MMDAAILFRQGFHITDLSIQHGGRICIMSGGLGGEFCTYIPVASEPALLTALSAKTSWFTQLFRALKAGGGKYRIIELIHQKFASDESDPYQDIRDFLNENNIKFTSEYWPDR